MGVSALGATAPSALVIMVGGGRCLGVQQGPLKVPHLLQPFTLPLSQRRLNASAVSTVGLGLLLRIALYNPCKPILCPRNAQGAHALQNLLTGKGKDRLHSLGACSVPRLV